MTLLLGGGGWGGALKTVMLENYEFGLNHNSLKNIKLRNREM